MGSELRIRGSLVLRLIAWFLFLSTVPLAVMAVFVRRNVTQAFIAHAERRYKQQVEMLALHISQLPEEQSQLELLAALTNDNQQAYIISPDGKYLLSPLPERIGKPISDQYSPETAARMLSGDSSFSTDDLSNEFISTLRIPERDQILVFAVSQEFVRRDLAELESSSFVQLGVSLLLISLIGGGGAHPKLDPGSAAAGGRRFLFPGGPGRHGRRAGAAGVELQSHGIANPVFGGWTGNYGGGFA
jgi:sensor histidine kinase regulating citrate/malate metabolism